MDVVAYGLAIGSVVDEGRNGGVGGAGEAEAILAFALKQHKQLNTDAMENRTSYPDRCEFWLHRLVSILA